MANKEHVALLKQGVDAWNEWRTKNTSVRPDLSGEDLAGIDLSNKDLSGANLREKDLTGAVLSNPLPHR